MLSQTEVQQIETKYSTEINELKLCFLQKTTQDDMRLVSWYCILAETGELPLFTDPQYYRLFDFIRILQSKTVVYTVDNSNQIDFVMSIAATGNTRNSAPICSLWISQTARKAPVTALRKLNLIYKILFEFYPAMLITTWQPKIVEEAQRIGYTICGEVPNWLDQKIVYFLTLLKEDFYNSLKEVKK